MQREEDTDDPAPVAREQVASVASVAREKPAPVEPASTVESASTAEPSGAGRFVVRPVIRPPRQEPQARQASRDETDEGWGDASGRRSDEWYLRERPPHHG